MKNKQLRYIKTVEDDRSPVDGREHHRVQKLYRTDNGSYIVASGLRFMHLNEVKTFHSNSKGFVDGKFEIEAIYGTHNIEEALKAMGYTVRGEE